MMRNSWFKGQLHAHSYWSDGRGFPEQAIRAYRDLGFHFLCLSEHNRFAANPDEWREVAAEEGPWPPRVSSPVFQDYLRTFGPDWVETREENGKTLVRLKTFDELKNHFEESGEFLLLPGGELTLKLRDLAIHLNYLNLPFLPPSIEGSGLIKKIPEPMSATKLIRCYAAEVSEVAGGAGLPYVLMLDHPFSFFCDVLPKDLIENPEVRFFEVCNNGAKFPAHPDAPGYDYEKFWDAVNAFRASRGQPLLLGAGGDDAHFYDTERRGGHAGVGDAWVMVRASSLTAPALIEAMHRGDFYASCGVTLQDVEFSEADRSLSVRVQAGPGERHRIQFITTKRGFDERFTEIRHPGRDGQPVRELPIYSEDIGRVVKVVEGNEGVYRMEQDDLYVRARVESERPAQVREPFHPEWQCAWTQPYPSG